MRLIHLANFGSTNVGNGALISGTERSLCEDLPAITLQGEAWDDYTFGVKNFDQSFVDLVNSSDGLLVGAAVTLNGQRHQIHTGTRVELPLPLWEKIQKPVIFYGISFRHWKNQRYHNLDALKRSFEYFLKNPKILLSVRNDGTKEWLEGILGRKLGDKIHITPDPALYLETTDHEHPEIHPKKKNIVLSLNNEDEVYRFGGAGRELAWSIMGSWVPEKTLLKLWKKIPGWDARRKEFLKKLARALEKVNTRHELNVILAPHYFDDYKAISEFIPLCPLRFPHQVLVSTGMARVSQTGYFYDLYKKADLSLSMRVHSMSPSVAVNTPMIALTSQSRMTEFLKAAGLTDYGIDIFDPAIEETLVEKILFALEHKEKVKNDSRLAWQNMRNETKEFHTKILKPFLGI